MAFIFSNSQWLGYFQQTTSTFSVTLHQLLGGVTHTVGGSQGEMTILQHNATRLIS